MAETLIRAWWSRVRGRLAPKPCPYSQAWVLDLPFRAWRAAPSRILREFGLRPGDRVLEIGPGTGYYSLEATGLVGPDGSLLCLDIQRGMLQELKRRLRDAPVVSVSLIQGDACQLPLRSDCVDHVFLITVLGELSNRRQALKEIRRVLRPDGRLSVSEQFPDPDFVTLRALRRDLSELGLFEKTSRGRLVYTSTWRVGAP